MAQAKTVLITGASAGIGRELVKVFAQHGFNVVLVARSLDKLEALAVETRMTQGVEAAVVAADLATPQGPQIVFDTVRQQGIAVDVLVNNAGVSVVGSFNDIPLARQLELLQLNVAALTALTHLFLQPMLKRANGRILNVASLAAFGPLPRVAVYAASKAYVLSFTEALAVELSDTGVSVTVLCPGPTATAMMEKWSVLTNHQAEVPAFLMMKPEDVAREGFEACMSGKTVYVHGLVNQLTSSWMQYSPRWLVRRLGGLLTRRAKPL